MSDATPARPTGAKEEQIEAAVRRGIPETMDWEYSAGCTVLMSIRDAAALLVPPGYSIVPDDQEEVGREVTGIAEQLATLHQSIYYINQRLDKLDAASAPVTPEPIDPVSFHIAEAYREFYAEGSGETDMDGMPELRVAYRARSGVIGDVHEEMLAYGRTS